METNALQMVVLLCAIIAIGGVVTLIADGYRRMLRDQDNHDYAGRKYALGPDRNEHGFPKGR